MTEKQPDTEPAFKSDGLEWFQTFEKLFRDSFQSECELLSSNPSKEDFQRAAASAVVNTLRESGITEDHLVGFLGSAISEHPNQDTEWTDEMNDRRAELIEKKFADSITNGEQFELGALTQAMRAAVDTEENLPLSGAKKLYDQLLNKDADD